jgi:DNA-binding LacI/PurR family transcriptional regulator
MTPHVDPAPWCDPAIAGSSPSPRRVTSIDVAQRAGVSQTTVSLVFSGKAAGRISEKTAEAVRRAARELGYRPNTAARALRSGSAAAVGMVVSDVTHPFFGRTLRGAQRAAWEAGHVVVLIDDFYGAAWGDESVETLRAGTIDGFLFFAAEPPASLRRPGAAPIVLVEGESGRLPHVRFDVDTGADLALQHLAELGHRRIASLRSAIAGQTFDRRHARWAQFLREHGEDPDDQVIVHSRFNATSTIPAGHAVLAQRDRFTAILCDDDVLAAGVLAAAAELNIKIPDEVSVVGFDDVDLARLVVPPLTTVRFDAEALGAAAFEALHARLQGRRPRNRVLEVELVVRGSTGPVS